MCILIYIIFSDFLFVLQHKKYAKCYPEFRHKL